MPEEAATACEHAFSYGENIAGVSWPDVAAVIVQDHNIQDRVKTT
jgi:hypothetical protein